MSLPSKNRRKKMVGVLTFLLTSPFFLIADLLIVSKHYELAPSCRNHNSDFRRLDHAA